MTTNGEWLFSKPFDEQVAWMHEEHQDGTLDGDTDALEAKQAICTVTVDYDDLRDKLFEELQRDYIIMTSEEYGELTAERDKMKELNEYHALQYELASEDADRLQADADRLQAQVYELTAERERYRSKFGKCLDYADAIHALMDDEGMA